MIYCCEEYEKAIKEITAQQIYCAKQTAAPLFTSPSFRSCPYCKTELRIEERRVKNSPVEIERRTGANLSSPHTVVNDGFPIKTGEE